MPPSTLAPPNLHQTFPNASLKGYGSTSDMPRQILSPRSASIIAHLATDGTTLKDASLNSDISDSQSDLQSSSDLNSTQQNMKRKSLQQTTFNIPSSAPDSNNIALGIRSATLTSQQIKDISNSGLNKRPRAPTFYQVGQDPSFAGDEEKLEKQSTWLAETLKSSPHYLALRERALPSIGGTSFANVTHTNTVTALSSINRHTILELIYQHLEAIGMYQTAEILAKESGHTFQSLDSESIDRTPLRLLTSLSIGNREDPWAITPDGTHQFIQENIEEDFFSSPYREHTNKIAEEYTDPNKNITFLPGNDHSFSKIKTASLRRIVIFLVNNHKTMTKDESSEFFLVLHSITSSDHFLKHLIALFDCSGSNFPNLPKNVIKTVQSGVMNVIRTWIIFHGLFIGRGTLKNIVKFCDRVLLDDSISYAHEAAKTIKDLVPKLRYGKYMQQIPTTATPQPSISNNYQIIFSPLLDLTGPDTIEAARQISLIYHSKFSTIHSLEFIIGMKNGSVTLQTPTISEFFAMDENLSMIIAKSFIESDNKSETYLRFAKICKHLVNLNNFDSVAVFLRILLMDDVKILAMQRDDVIQELQNFSELAGEAENKHKYHHILSECARKQIPAIPNIYCELLNNDQTIVSQPDYINGLINYEKFRYFGRKCSLFYILQNLNYNLYPIPQIQKVIEKETYYPLSEFVVALKRQISALS